MVISFPYIYVLHWLAISPLIARKDVIPLDNTSSILPFHLLTTLWLLPHWQKWLVA